jgi:class 3 adenylate cyclase/CHASE2 domain-containing sensor protein
VKSKLAKLVPLLVASIVIAGVALVHWLPKVAPQFQFAQRLELLTYDWRMKQASQYRSLIATNLGFVFMSDETIRELNERKLLGQPFGLYWPRHIYGRLVEELKVQGAKTIAFDVLFTGRRPDHAPVNIGEDKEPLESDVYFAEAIKAAGNVILAAEQDALPNVLFRTNSWMMADIGAERDADGVLRRARPYKTYRFWHPVIQQTAREYGFELEKSAIGPRKLTLVQNDGSRTDFPLNENGEFDLKDFAGDLPPDAVRYEKPFNDIRIWHMGIALAAYELGLDLNQPRFEAGLLILRGRGSVERAIPVDEKGYFFINWSVKEEDQVLTKEAIESLLENHIARKKGESVTRSGEPIRNRFANRLVVIGSTAVGSELTDRGATPLQRDTILVSKHWNVANAMITGDFIHPSSAAMDMLLIACMGVLSALVTWKLRALSGSFWVLIMMVAYTAAALFLFVQYRYWIPIVTPVIGSMLLTHIGLTTYRVIFEQNERRRVKSVFSKIVSPNVVNELLSAEKLNLVGARRNITVLFADVRGFTEMTDTTQARAEAYVKEHNLAGEAAEAYFDEQARETLETVNIYLATIADQVKKRDGTLDKYIGDCVMAFWGAPVSNERHAVDCVKTAIDAQRAMHVLNERRAEENKAREQENIQRVAAGLHPKPMLALLALGTGINSGVVTVGLMGSVDHIFNYTVFGREVNLASRLEGVSGRSRVIIGEATYFDLKRFDPELADVCVELPPVKVKGIATEVKIYEVPWRISTSSEGSSKAEPASQAVPA